MTNYFEILVSSNWATFSSAKCISYIFSHLLATSVVDPDTDPDPHYFRIKWGLWIRIQEGKNDPQKRKNLINLVFSSAECSLLRAEGFLCSLDVSYGSLGISKLQFLIKKRYTKNLQLFFLQFLVIKTLDSYLDPDSHEMLDSDP
jgi:hypothetical protein